MSLKRTIVSVNMTRNKIYSDKKKKKKFYLASNRVMVESLTEHDVFFTDEEFASTKVLSVKKPGCFG
jgi:hypothetical protein